MNGLNGRVRRLLKRAKTIGRYRAMPNHTGDMGRAKLAAMSPGELHWRMSRLQRLSAEKRSPLPDVVAKYFDWYADYLDDGGEQIMETPL